MNQKPSSSSNENVSTLNKKTDPLTHETCDHVDNKNPDSEFIGKVSLEDVLLQEIELVHIQLQKTDPIEEKSKSCFWNEMKQRLIANKPRQMLITSVNFEAKLISTVINLNYSVSTVLHSLRAYLLKAGINRNPYLQAQYCSLLLHMGDAALASEVDSLIDTLLQNRRLLAHQSRNYCIRLYAAISADRFIRVWTGVPVADRHRLISIGNDLLAAALQFNLLSKAIELLQALPSMLISDENVQRLIQSLLQSDPPMEQKRQFLVELRKRRQMFRPEHRVAVKTLLRSMNLTVNEISILNERCDFCRSKLESISQEEVTLLSDCVLKLLRKRVRTHNVNVVSDQEVQEFVQFLNQKRSAPFDLVVDGLNIAHICSTNKIRRYENKEGFHYTKSPQILEQSLISHLDLLMQDTEKLKRVLIIGRQHMHQWKKLERFVGKNHLRLEMYLVDNRSQDDLFTLFAALQNCQTFVLTGDILRQHHHKLDSRMEILFEKWISCRLSKPLRDWNPGVDRVIHFQANALHVPINYSEMDKDPVVRWLCASSQ